VQTIEVAAVDAESQAKATVAVVAALNFRSRLLRAGRVAGVEAVEAVEVTMVDEEIEVDFEVAEVVL
jgi:hypothetical protein